MTIVKGITQERLAQPKERALITNAANTLILATTQPEREDPVLLTLVHSAPISATCTIKISKLPLIDFE